MFLNHPIIPFLGELLGAGGCATERLCNDAADVADASDDDFLGAPILTGTSIRAIATRGAGDGDLLGAAIPFARILIGNTMGTILLRGAAILRDITGDADADDDADALDKLADFDAKGVPLADALFSFHASIFFLVFVSIFFSIFFIPFLNP